MIHEGKTKWYNCIQFRNKYLNTEGKWLQQVDMYLYLDHVNAQNGQRRIEIESSIEVLKKKKVSKNAKIPNRDNSQKWILDSEELRFIRRYFHFNGRSESVKT